MFVCQPFCFRCFVLAFSIVFACLFDFSKIQPMNEANGLLYDERGGSKKALDVCAGHDGPVSNICKAGLSKVGKGPEQVEKAIENAGSLEMAFLEKNMGFHGHG